MAESREPPGPVMATATRFHANHTGRQLRKILHHFFTAQLLAPHDLPVRIDAMYLKDLLCHIQSHCCNIHRGGSSLGSRLYYLDSGTLRPSRAGASIPLSKYCCTSGEVVIANKVFDGSNMIGELL